MSANNQTLIKQHGGYFYVFENVNAEAWEEDKPNELTEKEALGKFRTRDEAFNFAIEIVEPDCPTEYGVQFNRLCKDDSEVKIIRNK